MKKQKVLILGITGMAGHVIHHYFSNLSKYEVIGTSYRKKVGEGTILLDVTDLEAVKSVVEHVKPDFVINGVGVLIKGSKSNPANAILINSYFPHFLKELCRKQGSRLIHISTDCVFSGEKGGYKEESFRDADDVYGRSKALGEVINDTDLTIRTSIIGPELKENGEGLFHWFMSQEGTISGYNNVFWSGVTTLELAKGIVLAIENNLTGLFQLTNNRKLSKYDLLVLFKQIWDRDMVTINAVESTPKDKSFLNTRFPGLTIESSYDKMLQDQKKFMKDNSSKFNYSSRYQV